MRVADLVTEHPGGWTDIIAAARAYAPNAKVLVSTAKWSSDYVMKKKGSVEMLSSTMVPVMTGVHEDECYLIDILDSDISGISGIIAAGIYRIFLKYGIPVPGDKLWKKPASTWEIWRAL